MATRPIRPLDSVFKIQIQLTLNWIARGIEILMVAFTLFWSIEANAQMDQFREGSLQNGELRQNPESRSPAASRSLKTKKVEMQSLRVRQHDYSLILEKKNIRGLKLSLLEGKQVQAPEFTLLEEATSFWLSPLANATMAPLLRFSSF